MLLLGEVRKEAVTLSASSRVLMTWIQSSLATTQHPGTGTFHVEPHGEKTAKQSWCQNHTGELSLLHKCEVSEDGRQTSTTLPFTSPFRRRREKRKKKKHSLNSDLRKAAVSTLDQV